MNRRSGSRDLILDAAEAVVADLGAVHLTLDAVARRAQLSKGGLLYHYPSKEALLQGMLARLLERVEQDRSLFQADLEDGPTASLQAHILSGFQQHPERGRVSSALLAAGANDPRLLEPVREWQRRQFEELARKKRRFGRAAVVMLAVDGLWLNELLETSPLTEAERKEVLAELLALAKSVV